MITKDSEVTHPNVRQAILPARPAAWAIQRVQLAHYVGQASALTFFDFVYSPRAILKPEKLVAYRKRRPERPPAARIGCHTGRKRSLRRRPSFRLPLAASGIDGFDGFRSLLDHLFGDAGGGTVELLDSFEVLRLSHQHEGAKGFPYVVGVGS